jgi:hypothetical protein
VKEKTEVAERAARSRRGATSRRSSAPAEGLDRDYSGEEYREPGEGYNGPTPVKGLYPAKLVQVKNHQSNEGNDSVRWTFELTGGESPDEDGEPMSVAGFRDHQYTNDHSTLWREQQIAVALGLVKPNGKLKASFDAILKRAKPCTVRIIRERYVPEDGSDPEWRAKIAAVLSARPDSKTGAKSRRGKADDEPAEDVFDGDEDGDDEEETPPPRRSRSRRKAEPEPEPDEPDEDEEGDDGEEDWPEDPDELAAALEELSLTELKKVARDDFEVKITRGMKADEIIEAVLETLDEDEGDEEDEPEEDEPEEEPEPPKRRSRAAAAKTSTRRKRGSSQDPPF